MTTKPSGRGSGRSRGVGRSPMRETSAVAGSDVSLSPSTSCFSLMASVAVPPAPRPDIAMPERLVGLGFRGWITGYQNGDVGCWEQVWDMYTDEFGPQRAKAAVIDLSSFVKSVSACSRRRLEVSPLGQPCFGRDECLAISMVAAFQHNTCPAMRACAFALVESSMLDEVLHHASNFAVTLRSFDAVVPPAWIVNANDFVSDGRARPAAN